MKMKQYILGCMTVAVLFGSSVASVKADDLYPPPWQRGQPNTTYQSWDFGTAANPVVADAPYFNPNGTPTATINGASAVWSPYYDNHVGVWTLGAGDSIDFFIPNTPADNTRTKDIWTQITWQTDNNGSPVVTVDGVASTLEFSVPVGTGRWTQNVYLTTLQFNPSQEDVVVSGSLPGTTFDLGQAVIDTECVPEPSSLALLALGGISLLSYASRKR
jgi:PEP-CTERM motif